MIAYSGSLLDAWKELNEVFTTVQNGREIDMDAIHAVALRANREERIIHVNWTESDENK